MASLTTSAATIPCPARFDLTDGRRLDAVVYLLSDPARSEGHLTTEAVIDGPRAFIPVGVQGSSAFVARDAIRSIELDANGPGVGDLFEPGASFDLATLHLDSGEEISGILRTLSRDGASRMSDVFNGPGRFLTLAAGDKIVLVAKAHVVSATF